MEKHSDKIDDVDIMDCQPSEKDVCTEKLHPDDWVPVKLGINSTNSSDNNSPKRCLDKRKLAYEDTIQQLEEKIKSLLQRKDFTCNEARIDLKFVQHQTRYSTDVVLNRRIVERIMKFGIAHVFLRVWKSVGEVDFLNEERAPAFKNLQTILSIIWNCTDKSAALCDSLVRAAAIQLFLTELSSDKLINSDMKDENTLYLAKAYLGILHNIVRLCSDSRQLFRTANAIKILKCYLHSEQGLVKTKAYLILSYIINEEENDVINATDENIEYIIKILKEALTSENHFSKTYAFWAAEIACGLNHLAVNDANKLGIAKHGAIPLYIKLTYSDNIEEQTLGAAGLWILAFRDENKQLIRDEPGCMEALQTLANKCANAGIRRAARGALWVVRSAPERPPNAQTVKDAEIPHVMISYQWHAQATIGKLKNRLKAAGYKVWMDMEDMTGSTLEAMALAVEKAAVILVCMSQRYKDSPSCRTEAEYTYRLRKDIIPVLLQPNYIPDGWLGLLVGSKMHFDLTTEDNLDTQVPRLIKELGNRGRLNYRPATPHTRERLSDNQRLLSLTDVKCVCSDISLSSSTSSIHSYMRATPPLATWHVENVQEWLHNNQLAHIADRLEEFNGDLLLQYKKMMTNAPEYFYNSLEKHLKLDLVTSLKFTKALEGIS